MKISKLNYALITFVVFAVLIGAGYFISPEGGTMDTTPGKITFCLYVSAFIWLPFTVFGIPYNLGWVSAKE
jgi:hypothetical protein